MESLVSLLNKWQATSTINNVRSTARPTVIYAATNFGSRSWILGGSHARIIQVLGKSTRTRTQSNAAVFLPILDTAYLTSAYCRQVGRVPATRDGAM